MQTHNKVISSQVCFQILVEARKTTACLPALRGCDTRHLAPNCDNYNNSKNNNNKENSINDKSDIEGLSRQKPCKHIIKSYLHKYVFKYLLKHEKQQLAYLLCEGVIPGTWRRTVKRFSAEAASSNR